ncbi:family 16 glycosylhydrolase [Cerasicoccus arenae]|uniref:glycoside hydrolase family 16 protein n=1 Tax=Cerasicoccus arenae TaxID=424488 RepID=UPI0035E54C9F
MASIIPLQANESTERVLDIGSMKPSSSQVTFERNPHSSASEIDVIIAMGPEGYPGLGITSTDGSPWDLSDFGHIEAEIENTGETKLPLSLRVDNSGNWQDNPWNTESTTVKPGETKTLKVIFGHSYGLKPGYKLDPSKVSQLLFFTGKTSKAEKQFRIVSIKAAGPAGETPPVNPASVRTAPPKGVILGAEVKLLPAQIVATDGAEATLVNDGSALDVNFTKGKGRKISINPIIGKWDLRQSVAVAIRIKNTGTSPVSPRARALSQPGGTDVFSSGPIPPGGEGNIVVSFIPEVPWTGIKGSVKTSWQSEKGTGTRFVSNAVGSIAILADPSGEAQSMRIESIIAGAPTKALPEWIGKRPPVEGDWTVTFNEEFDGNEIDLTRWNVYTPNYWDKRSHFSKDNVIVGDGVCRLRFEKKKGPHADSPEGKVTDYATGFIDTYGKWVQRYGYFEARMKLPEAPGLWPAFWLMPDRGLDAGPQWKRQDSGNKGMEFDIMEFLSGWGVYRYNIAMHWNGYGKDHQQTGSTTIYFEPDAEGYITAGLLWTPGEAVFYANGEVVARWESPRISSVESDMMFTHVSGGWDNNGIDDAQLPCDFVIDYVRVWQRADLASEVDGVQSTQPTLAGRTEPDQS